MISFISHTSGILPPDESTSSFNHLSATGTVKLVSYRSALQYMFCFILQQRQCLAVFLEIHQTDCYSINRKKVLTLLFTFLATDLPEGTLKYIDRISLDWEPASRFSLSPFLFPNWVMAQIGSEGHYFSNPNARCQRNYFIARETVGGMGNPVATIKHVWSV